MEPSLRPLRAMILLAIGGCPLPADKAPDDSAAEPETCAGWGAETVLLADGSPSGFERCDDGTVHRVSAETFDPTVTAAACAGSEEARTCETDDECDAAPYGKCVTGTTMNEDYQTITSCGCTYSCASDADCADGQVCVPPGVVETGYDWPVCRDAGCVTDADCESGECGLTSYFDGCGRDVQVECRTDADACRSDDDCATAETCMGTDAGYECRDEDCAIGRLLLVGAAPRTAPPVAREDWAARAVVAMPEDGETRARLASHWAATAAMEHASVASFARATLQLLALGAPSDLVLETQIAAADEVRHAQIAYGLATIYGGEPVGPGPLALGDAVPALDVRSAMLALIDEACIGEVIGAAEVLAAAGMCTDPVVRGALLQVAADESRHAALAWRTLSWILDDHPSLAREAAERLAAVVVSAPESPDFPRYGVLGPARREAVRAAAMAEVVEPAIAAILERVAA